MAEFKTPVKKLRAAEEGDKITIPPSPFLNRLGYGTGVNVMQLVRSPRAGLIRSPWALKMLNKRVKPSIVYTERLQAEAELLKKMSHPNIVGFRAFSNGKILYLGMEACDQSLGDLVEKRGEDEGDPFTPMEILKVAADIGSALDYLHTTMQILHGDMKSFNILVNGAFTTCKLCDFGVTLPLDQNGVFDRDNDQGMAYYGTEAWSAPEVTQGGQITDRTDVWALGLTLWEMMALTPPHCMDDSCHSLCDDSRLDDSCRSMDDSSMTATFTDKYGTRPPLPAAMSPVQYQHPLTLYHACTEHTAADRPSADGLARAARDMMQHIQGQQRDRAAITM